MSLPTSVTTVHAASSQEAALKALIRASAITVFPDMPETALAPLLADIKLLIHTEAGDTAAAHDLSMALEHSPSITSSDGVVSLLTGANNVADHLSSALSVFLRRSAAASLLIPHAYATKAEISSLVARNHIPMCFQADQVYYCFNALDCEPESIRKSLGSTIAMYSVAWVFSDTSYDRKPVLAFVPVFDGDGWAVAGFLDTIFPTRRPQIH